MSIMGAVVKRMYQKELKGNTSIIHRILDNLKVAFKEAGYYLEEHHFLAWTLKISMVLLSVFIVVAIVYLYNLFTKLEVEAESSYATIGVELKRRYNLIPNLIIATKKYAVHEQAVFKYVADVRELLTNAKSSKDKERYSSQMDGALSKLFALFEQYPDLKASQSVQDLIRELTNTEDRIADQKSKYNKLAAEYNKLVILFPTNIFAWIFGYSRLFEYSSIQNDSLQTPEIQTEWNKEEIKAYMSELSVKTTESSLVNQAPTRGGQE